MNWPNLILRLVVVAVLAAAIIWLGLNRELLQPAPVELELRRFGGWAPLLFILLYAIGSHVSVMRIAISAAVRKLIAW